MLQASDFNLSLCVISRSLPNTHGVLTSFNCHVDTCVMFAIHFLNQPNGRKKIKEIFKRGCGVAKGFSAWCSWSNCFTQWRPYGIDPGWPGGRPDDSDAPPPPPPSGI